MCRKKARAKNGQANVPQNGNGKQSRRPKDRDQKKPKGYGKKSYSPHSKENGSGIKKNKPTDPKSFQKGMSKNSAVFFEKMFKHRNSQEEFLGDPNFP